MPSKRLVTALALATLIVIPACARDKAKRPSDKPMSVGQRLKKNLTEGATLLSMYAHNHRGRYPDSLVDLREISPYYREVMIDPKTGRDFVYVGKGLTTRDDREALLIAPNARGDGGLAVTVEGKLRGARRKEFRRAE